MAPNYQRQSRLPFYEEKIWVALPPRVKERCRNLLRQLAEEILAAERHKKGEGDE